MLVGEAIANNLVIVTTDNQVRAYPAKTIDA
jgi:hypothetical protein